MNALLLHSEDGQEYARVILYPAEWTVEQATARAIEVFARAQALNPDEWSWDYDYAPALTAAGFVLPEWAHGPTWDSSRGLSCRQCGYELTAGDRTLGTCGNCHASVEVAS